MEAMAIPERPIAYCTRCAEICARKPKTKLAGAKTTLFNPYLVSFKKAALDTTLGKLSDQHSRTTLPFGVGTLATEKYFNYDPSCCFIPKFGMMNLDEIEQSEEEEKFNEGMRKALEDAYQKTYGAFMMPIGRVIQIPSVKHISYLNFHVRLATPEQQQKWREFVHTKDLQHPYGGLDFMRKKFKEFDEADTKMIGHKGADPHLPDRKFNAGEEFGEIVTPMRNEETGIYPKSGGMEVPAQSATTRDGNLREFQPN